MFELNKEYHRKSEIHDIYGGQQRGGISTPGRFPFVLLFTSDEGEQYGYHDDFVEGVFHYTGEGQSGDMQMNKGNRAILEHSKQGKKLHVFGATKKGFVRYWGEAECLGYEEVTRPDAAGVNRRAYVFHLDLSAGVAKGVQSPKANYTEPNLKTLKKKSLNELRAAALEPSVVNSAPKEKKQLAYYRSEALKLYVIARSKGFCEACHSAAPFKTNTGPYLECHHMHRVADGGPDHPENVIALCPNCHRKAHYAVDAKIFNEGLQKIIFEKEKEQM